MADHYHRTRDDNRIRSRSPRRHKSQSHRDRSPHRHHKHHRGGSSPTTDSKPTKQSTSTPILLPFNSRPLTKRDYETFKPMFALYLDIQKGKVLEDLDEIEVKGRWKSFLGKWNRGELSEGWYDPSTLRKAVESAVEVEAEGGYEKQRERDVERPVEREVRREEAKREEEDSESDDEVGPALPGQQSRRRNRLGPSIPNMQDLELKKEMDAEDGLARRDDIRYERKLDRRDQKEKLDELVPRAEAGTRERQLEKKKELNEKLKGFREKDDGVTEVKDEDLMGGGDGIGDYKKQKEQFERKKNERELRKEEILRARMAEREERLMEYKVKEDATMAMLKTLAKQNFG